MRRYMCGVPEYHCVGSYVGTTKGLKNSIKIHATREQAFQCMSKYLKSQGYEQVGGREFVDPESGRVLVLTKKCRFGAAFRKGKSGDKLSKGKRFVPTKPGDIRSLGGCIS